MGRKWGRHIKPSDAGLHEYSPMQRNIFLLYCTESNGKISHFQVAKSYDILLTSYVVLVLEANHYLKPNSVYVCVCGGGGRGYLPSLWPQLCAQYIWFPFFATYLLSFVRGSVGSNCHMLGLYL